MIWIVERSIGCYFHSWLERCYVQLSNLGLPLSYAHALAHFRFIKNLDTRNIQVKRRGVLGGRVSLREVRLCPTHPPLKLKRTDVKNCSNKTEVHPRNKTLRFVLTVCLKQQLKQVGSSEVNTLNFQARKQEREAHAWRKRGRWLPTCRLGFIRAHH